MSKTSIEWSQLVWNPTTGCTKISQGCKYCYAAILSNRLKAMGQKKYKNNFKFTIHPEELKRPYSWKKPSLVFVNSMSDLFHEDMPLEFLKKIFKVMNENPHLIFQVLTKRADRLALLSSELNWSENIWMGVSIEDMRVIERLDLLKQCGAQTKFLSLEPLIGPLPGLNLKGIDWVIVGGEADRSKPREIKEEWVVDIQKQCAKQKTAFFFKQWGGKNKKESGRMLKGKEYNEMPPIYKPYK
jgi:protein gp37